MTLALLLLSIIPRDAVARDFVEITEVNHLHNSDGQETLCQVIFWRADGRCAAWRMNNQGQLTPVGNACWFTDEGIVRQVTARTVIETWTSYDPELEDRALLPPEKRRGLSVQRNGPFIR